MHGRGRGQCGGRVAGGIECEHVGTVCPPCLRDRCDCKRLPLELSPPFQLPQSAHGSIRPRPAPRRLPRRRHERPTAAGAGARAARGPGCCGAPRWETTACFAAGPGARDRGGSSVLSRPFIYPYCHLTSALSALDPLPPAAAVAAASAKAIHSQSHPPHHRQRPAGSC